MKAAILYEPHTSLRVEAMKLDELINKYRLLDEVNEAVEEMNEGVTARTILAFN